MSQIVTLPDGTSHEFPDEATPEMIAGALGLPLGDSQPAAAPAKPGFWDEAAKVAGHLVPSGRDVASMAGATLGGLVGAGAGAVGGPLAVPGAVAGSALGAEGAGQLYDAAGRLLGAPPPTSAHPLTDAAGNVLVNATLPAAAVPIVGATKYLFGGVGDVAGRMADYAAAGVRPMAADLLQSPFLQRLTGALAGMMPSSGTISAARSATAADVATSFHDAISKVGPTLEPAEAGEVLQQGGRDTISRFKAAAGQLYSALDRAIPGDTKVSVANLDAALEGPTRVMADAPETAKILNSGQMGALFQALQNDAGAGGTLSWKTMQAYRSRIGEQLGDPMLFSDASRADLKRVYGALTEDMRLAAEARGPEALNAFNQATTFYQKGLNALESTWTKLLAKNFSPENAYTLATSALDKGGTRLGAVLRDLQPTERSVVAGTLLGRIGQNAGGNGEFDAGTFLRNWSRMNAGAKDALFEGTAYQEVRPYLDLLSRVVENGAATLKAANHSNTAGTAHAIHLLTGGGAAAGGLEQGDLAGAAAGAAAGLALGVVPPWAAAKLITNPRVLRWLTTPVAANGWMQHGARLAAIGANDAGAGSAIGAYLDAYYTNPPPGAAPAPPVR